MVNYIYMKDSFDLSWYKSEVFIRYWMQHILCI